MDCSTASLRISAVSNGVDSTLLSGPIASQAKPWERQAARSLSCLWQHQGERDEADGLLVPIYGWFYEGFDMADLQEAKTLREELG